MTDIKSKKATTLEQSKLLTDAGLKPETADMCYVNYSIKGPNYTNNLELSCSDYETAKETVSKVSKFWEVLPAWSLDRLLALCPETIDGIYHRLIGNDGIFYCENNDLEKLHKPNIETRDNLFDNVVETVIWSIKLNHITKDYITEI